MTEKITKEALKARYAELCARRDEIEERIAPLREKSRAAASEAEAYRVKSMAVAQELFDARGGAEWFELKKEIGLLARMIGGR